MSVSKRLRFEVLKRDNHTCRYCGGTAPDVKLTVDHVTPVALGGGDDPGNLVAACRDCNAGKSSTGPDEATVADVSADSLRWAEAMRMGAEAVRAERQEEIDRYKWFAESWKGWDEGRDYLPDGWEKSIDCWLTAGLSRDDLLDCLDIALGNRGVSAHGVFAYMGGIARNRTQRIAEKARALLDAEEVANGDLD
jgi:hypothetical protein